jgi:cytoskeletal protein CcmA (bactofilin family)
MAMFDKQKHAKPSPPVAEQPRVTPTAPAIGAGASASSSRVALIGQGISIAGDVKADTSLKIEGSIEGRSVRSTDEIEVSESGQVIASIMAKVVKISGLVSGDIAGSEKVLISKTGRVQGNIVAPRVQLEDGALFRGSIDMNPGQSAEKEKPAAVKPAGRPETSSSGQNASSPGSGKNPSADADSARKEPGLNLKSG